MVTSLRGRYVILVQGRPEEHHGPDVNALVVRLRGAGARVLVLTCANLVADLLGRRVVGRPDLVVTLLPGRGPALTAVRLAERFGVPLMALVQGDDAAARGEAGVLRRAVRVLLTQEDTRERVLAAGARPDRVERWHWLAPGALAAFERTVLQSLADAPHARPTPPAGVQVDLRAAAAASRTR